MPAQILPVRILPPPPAVASALDLATFSYEDRRHILPAIDEAMLLCGCWLTDRKALSFTQTEFRFEMPLRSILELYAALIAAGLELTRASHLDLTSLCMLRKHRTLPAGFPSVVEVRLEVSFLEDFADLSVPARTAGWA